MEETVPAVDSGNVVFDAGYGGETALDEIVPPVEAGAVELNEPGKWGKLVRDEDTLPPVGKGVVLFPGTVKGGLVLSGKKVLVELDPEGALVVLLELVGNDAPYVPLLEILAPVEPGDVDIETFVAG